MDVAIAPPIRSHNRGRGDAHSCQETNHGQRGSPAVVTVRYVDPARADNCNNSPGHMHTSYAEPL